ncbi:hypothetical protein WA026_020902 [Henosepilachna vigintioctopunctata]|uniref:ATP synthase F0 subunit 8 n=1 Tax=Henosepilachna vigintioctopunctata TaxID=420089 RepID=A0AAW1UQX3_9CUCU
MITLETAQACVLTFSVLLGSLIVVFILCLIGWYIVWKLVLCRFKFIKELFRGAKENPEVKELKKGRSKLKKRRLD